MGMREAVERIRLLPDAFVDCSVRQGCEAILRQLNERTGENEEAFVDTD